MKPPANNQHYGRRMPLPRALSREPSAARCAGVIGLVAALQVAQFFLLAEMKGDVIYPPGAVSALTGTVVLAHHRLVRESTTMGVIFAGLAIPILPACVWMGGFWPVALFYLVPDLLIGLFVAVITNAFLITYAARKSGLTRKEVHDVLRHRK